MSYQMYEETPTMELRWYFKNPYDRPVFQQRWKIRQSEPNDNWGMRHNHSEEWRDIPTVHDEW